MLLSLLLAVFDDAADTGARRAASHEVARRLGIGWRPGWERARMEPPSPPAFVSLIRAARTITRHALAMNIEGQEALRAQCFEAAIVRLRHIAIAWLPGSHDNLAIHRVYPGYLRPAFIPAICPGLAYPAEDTVVLETHFIEALLKDPTPLSRHEADPLFSRLADALEAIPEGDWESVSDLLSADLIAVRDWVRETSPSLAGRTWAELVAGADAWHQQMRKGMGYGKPVPDAQVVLRWPDGVTLQRLFTKREFAGEGASMGHCVGGGQDEHRLPNGDSDYYRKTRDGLGATYSLRAPNGVPAATFEVVFRQAFSPDEAPDWRYANVTQIQGPEDGEIQSSDGPSLDGAPFGKDPVPYLVDGLIRLRLMRSLSSAHRGDFGMLSADAYDQLPGLTVDDTVAVPTWFPDLPSSVRARVLAARETTWRLHEPETSDTFWARVALAPASDVKHLFDGKS